MLFNPFLYRPALPSDGLVFTGTTIHWTVFRLKALGRKFLGRCAKAPDCEDQDCALEVHNRFAFGQLRIAIKLIQYGHQAKKSESWGRLLKRGLQKGLPWCFSLMSLKGKIIFVVHPKVTFLSSSILEDRPKELQGFKWGYRLEFSKKGVFCEFGEFLLETPKLPVNVSTNQRPLWNGFFYVDRSTVEQAISQIAKQWPSSIYLWNCLSIKIIN